MKIHPYLYFDGRCREAFTFYQSVLGGTLEIMDFSDMPSDDPVPPGMSDRVMHASLGFGDYSIMGSDNWGTPVTHSGSYISLSPDPADIERLYTALSAGGKIEMALQKTFWTPQFAMFADRFGVQWMLNGPAA